MKKEKLKVFLQYPWKISDSQYYKNILDYPPKGVEYLSEKTRVGMITNKKKLAFLNSFKAHARSFVKKFRLNIPNMKKTRNDIDYDLIHCAHCLSGNNSPWVADFESYWQMWVSAKDDEKGREKISKILEKENCKKLIAWTEASKRTIIKNFPLIKDKIEVVYHGQPVQKFKKIRKEKITLLFIGRYFRGKGGLYALEVMDRLTKKYENVDGLFISVTPKEVLEKYSSNKKIKFLGLIPHKEIQEEIFPLADILIYPGFSDTFGFIFTEAMSFGVPVVTVDGFARKELVENNKTGFVIPRKKEIHYSKIDEEIVKKMIEKTEKLINDGRLRKRMSKESLKTISNGKFSIRERNNKLGRIYRGAFED